MKNNNIKLDLERNKYNYFISDLEHLITESEKKVKRDKTWLNEAEESEKEQLQYALNNSLNELENLRKLSNKFWKCFSK